MNARESLSSGLDRVARGERGPWPTLDDVLSQAEEEPAARGTEGWVTLLVPPQTVSIDRHDPLRRWFDGILEEAAERGVEIAENGSGTQYSCGFTFLNVRIPPRAVSKKE
jgi:hypothetical protein